MKCNYWKCKRTFNWVSRFTVYRSEGVRVSYFGHHTLRKIMHLGKSRGKRVRWRGVWKQLIIRDRWRNQGYLSWRERINGAFSWRAERRQADRSCRELPDDTEQALPLSSPSLQWHAAAGPGRRSSYRRTQKSKLWKVYWRRRPELQVLLSWQWVYQIFPPVLFTAWSRMWVQLQKGSAQWLTQVPAFQVENQKGEDQGTSKDSRERRGEGVRESNPPRWLWNPGIPVSCTQTNLILISTQRTLRTEVTEQPTV